jgi:hypothetical protein
MHSLTPARLGTSSRVLPFMLLHPARAGACTPHIACARPLFRSLSRISVDLAQAVPGVGPQIRALPALQRGPHKPTTCRTCTTTPTEMPADPSGAGQRHAAQTHARLKAVVGTNAALALE